MDEFRTFELEAMSVNQRYGLMTNLVVPRPIAWVSTQDADGKLNLSPFSYFNCFGSNPPLVGFSPCLGEKDGQVFKKDTLVNIEKTKQCVIHLVDREMLHPMVLSSAGYASNVDEFAKAGVTPVESLKVRVPRVQQAKVALECELVEVHDYAAGKGGTQLVICKVLCIHVAKALYKGDDLTWADCVVGRLGGQDYHVIEQQQLIKMPKNVRPEPIGVDAVIHNFPQLKSWSYNDLAKLANIAEIPDETAVNEFKLIELSEIFMEYDSDAFTLELKIVEKSREFLADGRAQEAWMCLLALNI